MRPEGWGPSKRDATPGCSPKSRRARRIGLPLVAVSNLSGDIHPELAAPPRRPASPYLRGDRGRLLGARPLRRWAAAPPRTPALPTRCGRSSAGSACPQPAHCAPSARMPSEDEARDILAPYGIDRPRERLASTSTRRSGGGRAIGFPVVLKCLVADLIHKTEAGLVEVGLRSTDALAASARGMLERAQRPAGGSRPPGAGAGSPGGGAVRRRPDRSRFRAADRGRGRRVLVELYRDVAVRLAPIDEEEALEALRSTRPILDGFRGRPPGDASAAARAMAAVSRFAAAFADAIAEVEVNPLAVLAEGQGCKALDCALVLARAIVADASSSPRG